MGKMNRIRMMSENEMAQMHESTLRILEETGLTMLSDKAIEYLKKGGCIVDGYNVRYPRAVVEKALKTVPSSWRWLGRGDNAVTIGGDNQVVGPNLGCVYMEDMDKGRRIGTLEDYATYQKILQASNVVDVTGCSIDVGDVPLEQLPLQLTYQTLKNTNKPHTGFLTSVEGAAQTLDMLEIAFGGKKFLDENIVTYFSGSPLSPLGYDEKTLDNAIEYITRGQAMSWTPAAMGGLTAPLSAYGVALLCNVESIGGMVFAQMVREGAPCLCGISSTVADMRKALYNAGSPMEKMVSVLNLQMMEDFYNIPRRVMCGITESKQVDYQAGAETMQNVLMATLGGTNLYYEILGITESIMTTNFEKIILDLEVIERTRRIREGVEADATEDELARKAIQEIGPQGNYMTQKLTLKRCRKLWYPSISNWDTYEQWEGEGSVDIVRAANKKWKEMVAAAPETFLSPDVERDLQNYIKKNS